MYKYVHTQRHLYLYRSLAMVLASSTQNTLTSLSKMHVCREQMSDQNQCAMKIEILNYANHHSVILTNVKC